MAIGLQRCNRSVQKERTFALKPLGAQKANGVKTPGTADEAFAQRVDLMDESVGTGNAGALARHEREGCGAKSFLRVEGSAHAVAGEAPAALQC